MIQKETIGEINKFTITGKQIQAEFISFGARMTKIIYNGIDVLLGYDDPADYLNDKLFIGATVGRFAGRIGNASLQINGNSVQLDQNENTTTCHHGGYRGFDKWIWESKVISENSVCFTRTSPDGEGGFPGNLSISVQYTLLDDGIEITHSAKTDQETIVNLTNHAYFNLSGYQNADARELFLQLNADNYLPLNEKLIPTGEIRSVESTSFNFKKEKKIQTDLDHFFIFSDETDFRRVGRLRSETTGICMDIATNQRGVQIYTCGAFEADHGKGGIPLHRNQGIALETQGYPDSPNHISFPTALLKPNETYVSKTRFIFSIE